MTQNKRTRVLVDGSVQWALVGQSLVHWLYHILVTILLLALLQVLLGGVFKTWSEHWETIWPLALSVSVSMLVLLPKFIYDSLELSSRFAGPVTRLRRVLRDVAAGKPFQPVRFRGSDFWNDMAQEFNTAVERLLSHEAGADAELDSVAKPVEEELGAPVG